MTTNAPTYEGALAAPVKDRGWRYADAYSSVGALAQSLAERGALRPVAVYGWILRHYGEDWLSVVEELHGKGRKEANALLLTALLHDVDLKEAESIVEH